MQRIIGQANEFPTDEKTLKELKEEARMALKRKPINAV